MCAVQAGVGIFFQQEADGSVYVKTIVSGGSAERDGVVRVGDMILGVDDREVRVVHSSVIVWLLVVFVVLLVLKSVATLASSVVY